MDVPYRMRRSIATIVVLTLVSLVLPTFAASAAPVPGSVAALQFNGTSQYVGFGNAPAVGLQSFTIETWFKRTGAGTATSTGNGGLATVVPLVTKGRGEAETPRNLNMNWFLGINTNNTATLADDVLAADFEDTANGANHPIVDIAPDPDQVGGVTPILADTWYHAAVSYDHLTGTWRLFLNGALEREQTLSSAFVPELTSIQDLAIGSALTSNGTAAGFFQGVIDEVRVWDEAHTLAEVRDTLNQEVPSSTPGLAAMWHLNEGTGTSVVDALGSTNSTTFAATPIWTDGYPFNPVSVPPGDYALNFGGNNAYVDLGDPSALDLSNFTIEAWVKKAAGGSTVNTGSGGIDAYPIVTKGRAEAESPNADINYFLGIDGTGHVVADFEEGASGATPGLNHPVVGSSTIANGEWHHVAATYDETTMTLYVDGVQDGSIGIGQPANAASIAPVGIGTAMNSLGRRGATSGTFAGGYFSGIIDEVRIWDHARTSGQILAARDVEIPADTGLVSRFGLNEGTATVAGDSAGDDHSGTVFNGAWVDGFSVTPAPPDCAPNCALDFSSAGQQHVTFGDPASLDLSEFTIETWFRRDGTGTVGTTGNGGIPNAIPLVTHGSQQAEDPANLNMNWYLGIDNATDTLAADFEEAAAGTGATGLNHPVLGQTVITDGVWHHAAATYDGESWNLYLDGVLDRTLLVDEPVESGSIQHAALATSIQSNGTVLTGFFDGALDEARVWNRALSLAEIQANMSQELTSGTGLVARWGLNEGTGNAIDDSVGASNGTGTNGPSWIDGAPFGPANLAPDAPTIVSPADDATNVARPPGLEVGVTDPEGDPVDVDFYGRPVAGAPPAEDFTVVAIPDTQHYVDSSAREIRYRQQTQWVVDSRDTLNTKFVTHLGDIVENRDQFEQQWIYADAAMDILDNAGVPNNLAPGNHDLDEAGVATFYDEYFPPERYDSEDWYGGYLGDDGDDAAETTDRLNKDNYELFEVGGLEFLIIHLEADMPDYAIDWAQNVIDAYPNRRVIISTHMFLSTTGSRPTDPYFRPDGNSAQEVWTQLIAPNCNVFLVLNGHYPGEARRVDDNSCGDPVHQVEADYQSRANGGDGWLRYMTFEPSQNEIEVFTYSPSRNGGAGDFENDADSRFTLDYDMEGSSFQQIGTDSNVASGATAGIDWTGLDPDTEYEWYAVASDASHSTTGPTASFTTAPANSPPVLDPIGNKNLQQDEVLAFTATASDPDVGDTLTFSLDDGTSGTVPPGASITAGGAFTWTPSAPQVATFDVCVSDGTDTDCETITVTVTAAPAAGPLKDDFDADGRSDLLWRHATTGENYLWFMNGTALDHHGPTLTLPDTDWKVMGTGDFDGDADADIVWRNTATDRVDVWLMDGTTVVSSAPVFTLDPTWKLVGTGDFDGDAKADILWRNTATGENYIWFMDGTTLASHGSTLGLPDLDWKVVGTGDFDGDANADIAWRNTSTDQVYVWLMDGTTLLSHGAVFTLDDANWTLEGTGDYNGNGKDDLLWQHSGTGEVYVWLMNGTSLASSGSVFTLGDPDWDVAGTGDYDGDGKADIAWRNASTGEVYVWLMNGTTLVSSGSTFTLADSDWQIVPTDPPSGTLFRAVPDADRGAQMSFTVTRRGAPELSAPDREPRWWHKIRSSGPRTRPPTRHEMTWTVEKG